MQSILWYDYETSGIDSQRDRILQFAAIRTNENLEIISNQEYEYFCQLAPEILPNLEATLITGLTPKILAQKGLVEWDFINQLHKIFSFPGTCICGYNSIRFDDEFTRYAFYRNFYDAYQHEWMDGNSRWDLIDIMRIASATRPDGINWPKDELGNISYKLEELSIANDISHHDAHNALSDVRATLGLSQLLQKKQPKLFTYFYQHRTKKSILSLIDKHTFSMWLHSSRMFSANIRATSVIYLLDRLRVNNNAFIAIDLRYDPQILLDLSSEEIKQHLFNDIDSDSERHKIPLKLVHINKAPILVPMSSLSNEIGERIKIKDENLQLNYNLVKEKHSLLYAKIAPIFDQKPNIEYADVDHALYEKFIPNTDKVLMANIHNLTAEEFLATTNDFRDTRLRDLAKRYIAKRWPRLLSDHEKQDWQNYQQSRINDNQLSSITFSQLQEKLLHYTPKNDQEKLIVQELTEYMDTINIA